MFAYVFVVDVNIVNGAKVLVTNIDEEQKLRFTPRKIGLFNTASDGDVVVSFVVDHLLYQETQLSCNEQLDYNAQHTSDRSVVSASIVVEPQLNVVAEDVLGGEEAFVLASQTASEYHCL